MPISPVRELLQKRGYGNEQPALVSLVLVVDRGFVFTMFFVLE